MFNFTKTNKSDSLNDKLQELENRFQEKMDEQTNAYKRHIQKLDEKFAGMEEKNKITYELMDKLYEYRFQEINNNTAKLSTQMSCKINQCISVYDNKLDNTFTTLQQGMQNITNQINILNNNQKEIFIEIQKLKNNAGNHFEEKIDTLTKQQEVTNEKLVALNENVSELDDKIDELEKKTDETNWSVCYDIKQIEEKLNKDAELWDITGNLQDNFKKIDKKIYNFEEQLRLIVGALSDHQLEIKKMNNPNIDTSIITDRLEMCVNDIKKINAKIYEMELENISNPNIDTSIITDKLEICMNAIKKINVYQFPNTWGNRQKEEYVSQNKNLGSSIIMIDDAYEFSYINQFYNLKVLVINNWQLFNYGIFDVNMRNTAADTFTKMRDRYGEMNNKTLETFIIHTAYDFKTWATQGITTRKEPLLLEYLCMQFKNFPYLKIIKLYYLDLPENIEDILIHNLKLMTHSIKELHIITNNNLKALKLKNYCNYNNIMFVVPKFNEFILKNPQSIPCFNMAFQWEVVQQLKQQLMMEDDSYMRINKGYN